MNFDIFLKTHPRLSQFMIQAANLFLPALYVGLLMDKISKHSEFYQAVKDLGNWNFLLILQLIVLVIGIRLITVVRDAKAAVRGLLATNSRALSFAVKGKRRPMRVRSHFGICENGFVIPKCHFNLNGLDDDDRCVIEISQKNAEAGIMVVRAILSKACLAENLLSNAHSKYPESLKAINPDIKAVLACPVMDFETPESNIIGIISFDIMDANIEDFHCTVDELKGIIRETAQTVYMIWNQ